MRVGSRVDPLLGAFLAAAAARALEMPASMVQGRARLASLQQVLAAQTPPRHEETARAAAVQHLLADPATDVVSAVLDARRADLEAQMRADLLQSAVETASDEADVLPDGWGTLLLDAHTACVRRLRTAYNTFSRVSTDPDLLWGAPQPITSAWTSFTRAAIHFEAIMAIHRLTRATSPTERDTEGLFSEVRNMDVCWPERISSLRPLSTLREPWPPRSGVLNWLLWVHQHGGVLYLPSREQQDAEWGRVFGQREREFAAGARHLTQMRETFG